MQRFNPLDFKYPLSLIYSKSELCGLNFTNLIMLPLLIVAIIFVVWNPWHFSRIFAILLPIGAFFILVIAQILLVTEFSKQDMKKEFEKIGETPKILTTSDLVLETLSASVLLEELANTIANCAMGISPNIILFKPWIGYSKRPLMKIAKEEIISASESEQRISVGQLDTQNATANTAATIGTTNTLLSEMDKRHMHDRIRMSIATKDRTYQFIFNKKDRAAVQAILELAPKA